MPSLPIITNVGSQPGQGPIMAALAAREERLLGYELATRFARVILLFYASIYYVLPAVLTAIFGAPLDQILIASPNYVLGAIVCFVVIGATYLAAKPVRLPRPLFLRPFSQLLFSPYTVAVMSFVFLLLAGYFWRQFGLSYRQNGSRIEDSGSAVILLYLFQNYILTTLVIYIGYSGEQLRERFLLRTTALTCILVGTLLSVQAASNALSLAAALVVAVRLWIKKNFLRAEGQSQASKFVTLMLFGVAVLGALFVGIANKRGVDQTIYLFSNDIGEIIRVFQTRISYNFYSASFHATFNLTNMQLTWQAVQEVATNVQHRIDVLLGKPTTFNEITSVKRLNFELIAYYFRERTGTAPGLVGSIFFYPLGIFALPLVVVFYAAVFKMLAEVVGTRRCSLIELAFLMLFVGGMLDSSIDLFNPFDTPFTKLFFLLCAYSMIGRTASERLTEKSILNDYARNPQAAGLSARPFSI